MDLDWLFRSVSFLLFRLHHSRVDYDYCTAFQDANAVNSDDLDVLFNFLFLQFQVYLQVYGYQKVVSQEKCVLVI